MHWRISLLLLLLTSCYPIERNCSDFKTGTFTFDYVIDGENKTGKFVRTEDFSIDYFENKVDSASIRWVNDCEFVLKKLNPKRMSEEKAIHFKILTTTASSYTFEYNFVGETNKQKGTANRID